MENRNFRQIKSEIRILGIDDAPFTPRSDEDVLLVGTVFRGGHWLDGVLTTKIRVDGDDATEKIVEMVNGSRHLNQLRVIMLDGLTFGGFNVADINEISSRTGLPVIVVVRKYPDLEGIRIALKHRFPDWKKRWQMIDDAGEIHRVESTETVYIQTAGIDQEDAAEIVRLSTTRSSIPEPLRAAHLIASGVKLGESRGSA